MFKQNLFMAGLFFLSLLMMSSLSQAAPSSTCVVCGMEVKPNAKASFESIKEEKSVPLCSYTCAHRYHSKYADLPLFTFDFDTGSKLDAKSAYYLVKSHNVLKEVEFGMAPTVVAFASEAEAQKNQTRLKDGEVVKGYEALEKTFK